MYTISQNCSTLLGSLGYPYSSISNPVDLSDVVRIVAWLEDRKIRKLEISERENLRNHSEHWNDEFKKVTYYLIVENCSYYLYTKYLEVLKCPIEITDKSISRCLTWLVEYAVSLEYEDVGKLKFAY